MKLPSYSQQVFIEDVHYMFIKDQCVFIEYNYFGQCKNIIIIKIIKESYVFFTTDINVFTFTHYFIQFLIN